jgi:sterol desaturase/sphingolipid hydroxylase (fatty acid hydroxylase superfamily)
MNIEIIQALGRDIDDVFFLIGAAILLIEIAEAAFKRKLKLRNLSEMLVSASTQIPFLLFEILIFASAYGLYYIIAEGYISWSIPANAYGVALAVLVADFAYYWEHRIAHQIRLLWTQHAVHHSSRDMNIVTGLRFGPFEGVWSMISMLPMVFMGFSPEMILFGALVVQAYQTWIHTDLIGKLGPLEKVLNTPSHHRVHHGSDRKYLDKNYGGILIIWDRMFGSFQVEEETPIYGLTRDFDSRNPVRVWFSEIPELGRDLRGAKSLGEVWMRLFGKPGWTPRRDP